MGNPLRSEAEAFRWLLVVGAAAASVIALALLVRPLAGVLWALVLIVAAVVYGWRLWRARS